MLGESTINVSPMVRSKTGEPRALLLSLGCRLVGQDDGLNRKKVAANPYTREKAKAPIYYSQPSPSPSPSKPCGSGGNT
jgi:hypothetical protein